MLSEEFCTELFTLGAFMVRFKRVNEAYEVVRNLLCDYRVLIIFRVRKHEISNKLGISWNLSARSFLKEVKIGVNLTLLTSTPFLMNHVLLAQVNQALGERWVHRGITFENLPDVQFLEDTLLLRQRSCLV